MSDGALIEDRAIRIRPKAASNLLLWTVLALLVIAFAWAALTEIDRTVRGQGKVIPSSQLQIISNLEGGVVEAILVRTGQVVKLGTPLLRLNPIQSGADLESGQATHDALLLKIARLEAEIAGQEPRFPPAFNPALANQLAAEQLLHRSRIDDLTSLLRASEARVSQAERAIAEAQAAQASRLSAREAARTELEMIRPLVREGIEPRLTLVQAENAAAIAANDAAGAAATLARARSSLAEARATASQQQQDWKARAADELTVARAELNSRSAALPALTDRVKRTTVRAPLAGRINRVLVTTVGGSVRPGDPLLEMVPSDESLLVEAMVLPKDIASVKLGQKAKVNISAYDSAVYGSLWGRVVSISPDAVVNERTGDSHYLVRIRTDGDAIIDRAGRKLPIGSGMGADVSLIGDKRTVLSYILTPITRLQDEAFHE